MDIPSFYTDIFPAILDTKKIAGHFCRLIQSWVAMAISATVQHRFLVLALLLALMGCANSQTTNRFTLDNEVNRLCAIDAGIKVYETVAFPSQYVDRYGQLRIPSKNLAKQSDEYYYEYVVKYMGIGNPENIWRSDFRYFRRLDEKLLGQKISYSRRGGDLFFTPMHDSSYTCPPIDPNKPQLEDLIFRRSNVSAK